jgi:hypothetical protein
MTTTWNRRLLLVSVLLLILVMVTPVAATTIRLDLSKTYQFKHTNLSTIQTLDLWDPSVSKVELQSSIEDNSDIRVLQQPRINTLTRVFTTTTGTFAGNTITIQGANPSTIDYRSRPDYKYYVTRSVPTLKVTVPGYTGNPMVTKYNESWSRDDTSSTNSILNAANTMYLYNGTGILHINATGNVYTTWGGFDTAPLNKNDINYTLNNNVVSLNPFAPTYESAEEMGFTFDNTKASTGKYFAGALRHDEGMQTTTIYALTPMVVLNEETPITWTDDYGVHNLPFTYVKGEMGDATLKFTNTTNVHIKKIGYMFVNSTAQYNMVVKVNTTKLAENAENTWQDLSPADSIIEILYDGILQDFGPDSFTYNLTAVGQPNAPDATYWSQLAITPGYGISGNLTTASAITIPKEAFSSLNDGVYYVYMMGIDNNNDIVALSQSTVFIRSGAIPDPSSTTIATFAPATGYRNSVVSFTLTGTGFPAELGTGGVNVSLTKTGSPTIMTTITSVTSTKITGTFSTGTAVNGARDVVLYTNDAGETIKTAGFTIVDTPAPAITTVVPASTFRNATVNFTLTGTAFAPDADDIRVTFVNFADKGGANISASLLTISPTSITGYVTIPKNANPSSVKTWVVNVTTAAGGRNKAGAVFTVNAWPVPAITGASPITAAVDNNVTFTLTGTGFQPDVNGVKMTWIDFANSTHLFNATVSSVTGTKITGYIFIPDNTTPGAWKINVSTADGGVNKAGFAFTVTGNNQPSITSAVPASAFLNQSINFTLKGTNFQADLNGNRRTIVNFTDTAAHNLNATLLSVNGTTIIGYVKIPYNTAVSSATNKWKINVTTADGGQNKAGFAFTITQIPPPAITTGVPGSAYLNETINFTLKGTNFQAGSGMTVIDLTNATWGYLNTSLLSVNSTTVVGYVKIPNNTVVSSKNTKWQINATTIDGGMNKAGFAFTVSQRPAPVITTFAPTTVSRNTTITFNIAGKNFYTKSGYTTVSVMGLDGNPLYGTITSATDAKLTGTLVVPWNAANGPYDLNVTTVDGGTAIKESAFIINFLPLPTILTINQTSGLRNTTVPFLITGNNFQPDGGTWVRLYSTTSPQIDAVLTNVTSTKMSGTFTIPYNAGTGKYRLDVFTVSGGGASKLNAFTVNAMPKPVITTVTPTSSYRNRTFVLTVLGNNFQPNGGTNVTLSNPDTGGGVFEVALIDVTPTRLNGTITIPAGAPTSPKWKLNVSTVEGGIAIRPAAITINAFPKPTIGTMTPATDFQNQTVSFTLTGTNFQAGGTNLTFWNKTSNQVLQPTVYSITPTQVVGSVVIPGPATAKAVYWANITTVDGGAVSKDKALTISPLPKSIISSITPGSGQAGTTVPFTIVGKYFEPKKGTTVRFENGATVINAQVNTVYTTRVLGSVTIPGGATTGPWTINVTTADAGTTLKTGLFSVF